MTDPCGFTVEILQTTFEDNGAERQSFIARAGTDGALKQGAEKCIGVQA